MMLITSLRPAKWLITISSSRCSASSLHGSHQPAPISTRMASAPHVSSPMETVCPSQVRKVLSRRGTCRYPPPNSRSVFRIAFSSGRSLSCSDAETVSCSDAKTDVSVAGVIPCSCPPSRGSVSPPARIPARSKTIPATARLRASSPF